MPDFFSVSSDFENRALSKATLKSCTLPVLRLDTGSENSNPRLRRRARAKTKQGKGRKRRAHSA